MPLCPRLQTLGRHDEEDVGKDGRARARMMAMLYLARSPNFTVPKVKFGSSEYSRAYG